MNDDSAPATVLVIDDNATNRYLLATWLRRAGHTVVECADGGQGIALLDQPTTSPPEIAIVDVNLPDMSGLEVCERVKGSPHTAGMPVVLISASAITPDHHSEGLRRGADSYLNQPIDPGELLATVAATLRYARAHRRAERLAERLTTLNRTTLEVHRAIGFHSYTSAATGGAAALMSSPATAIFLSPMGQAVHTHSAGPGEFPRSLPARADLLDQLAGHATVSGTGAEIVTLSPARWRALLPHDHLSGEVAVVIARTLVDRPPICLAVPAGAVRDADDVNLFRQLAHACALSLEALRSYNEEHSLALALQRTFLPRRLPSVPGLELAFRYQPASDHAEIGGDFYEALHTADGTLLAIGDIVGHSLAAATVMGEVRHALRAYAVEGHPPRDVLDRLESLLAYSHPNITATLCLALVEPGARRIHIANAGHIPPLLLPAAGDAAFLQEHGPMLGLGLPHPPATAYDVAPGTRLVLITDGLVEERSRDLEDCLAAFRGTAESGPAAPEQLCDALLLASSGDRDDDIAILAARFV